MKAVLLLLPLVLDLPLMAAEVLPPIFVAAKPRPPAAAMAAPAPLSEHLREAIAQRAAAMIAGRSAAPPPMAIEGNREAEVVMMDKVVVNVPPSRRVEARRSDSPLRDFVRTGTFYRRVGPTGTTEREADLHVLPVVKPGVMAEPFTRVEVAYRIWW